MFSSKVKTLQATILINLSLSIFGLYHYGASMLWVSALMYFVFACLGIIVTFHRYLCHKSFEMSKNFERIFSVFGCLAGTGSSIAWVATHFNHHRYSDRPLDPHSPKYTGLKMFTLDYRKQNDVRRYMKYLLTDPFHQWLHRYYLVIHLVYAGLLLSISLETMIFFYCLPSVVVALMSNVVNYVGHRPTLLGGFRTHNLNDDSANNILFSPITFGEAMHNNHHRYPRSSTTGTKWYHFDISGWVIGLIKVKQ
jgi:stearoyl-CoA desaturase (delta-9 desaturase)